MLAHVCPWWLNYCIDNPLRRFIHNPDEIFGPYVNRPEFCRRTADG